LIISFSLVFFSFFLCLLSKAAKNYPGIIILKGFLDKLDGFSQELFSKQQFLEKHGDTKINVVTMKNGKMGNEESSTIKSFFNDKENKSKVKKS